MKVNDINIDRLLYTEPVRDKPYDNGEEDGGFFRKLFSKKNEPEVPFFNTRVEEFGRDALYEDIKEGCDAYIVNGAPFETMTVLSQSYLILPGKEIFPLFEIAKYGIYNEPESKRNYEQYAIDRFDEPYDPDFVSEYDNEEGFELDRFNIWLILIDRNNIRYEYVFPMEVPDRKDFRAQLNERLSPINAEDHSAEDVMEGRFSEDDSNLFYLY